MGLMIPNSLGYMAILICIYIYMYMYMYVYYSYIYIYYTHTYLYVQKWGFALKKHDNFSEENDDQPSNVGLYRVYNLYNLYKLGFQ